MLRRLWSIVSLGQRYMLASLVYVGLALIVASALPDPPQAQASGTECDDEEPCGEDEQCCDGECIPDDDLCCEDGTSGPADENCACCGLEEEDPSSYVCSE